jgi:arsenical pump membrane protein
VTTIFTSNDIVILTFTPFIIHLAKEGKFKPLPYLVMEFVAGNTFSMLLQIGNPTNIYLSTVFGVDFVRYFEVMAVPTLIIGVFSIAVLLLIFHRDLSKPIEHFDLEVKKVNDPFLMYVSLIHLVLAIICLAISNIIGIEMWMITLGFALSMSVILILYSIVKKKNEIGLIYKKLPYSLVPFILSMFVIIMAEDGTGLFGWFASILNSIENPIIEGWAYLASSTLACNFVNNIPMSLMFSRILDGNLVSVFSVIIGSNLGALLTPIGALAGIMWMSILKHKGVHFSFGEFMKYGAIITGFMLIGALGAVSLIPFFI